MSGKRDGMEIKMSETAHMIPPVPKSFDPRSEEGLVFNALRKLSSDYYVFHNVAFDQCCFF